MSDNAAYVLAAAIIIAGLFSGGFYSIAPGSSAVVYRVNKFTGNVVGCSYDECK